MLGGWGAMKAAVIVFPGSNCDRDVEVALEASTGRAPAMVWHDETALPTCDLIVLPGGFAHGDYPARGRHGGALAGDGGRGEAGE